MRYTRASGISGLAGIQPYTPWLTGKHHWLALEIIICIQNNPVLKKFSRKAKPSLIWLSRKFTDCTDTKTSLRSPIGQTFKSDFCLCAFFIYSWCEHMQNFEKSFNLVKGLCQWFPLEASHEVCVCWTSSLGSSLADLFGTLNIFGTLNLFASESPNLNIYQGKHDVYLMLL